jgi:hypothetical protein
LTVTANYGISPDGTQNADRLQMTVSTGYADLLQAISTTPSAAFTYSIYLKSLSGTPTIVFFNDGVTGNKQVTLTTDWKRYTFTVSSAGAVAYPRLLLENGVTSSSADFLAWGAQLEQGAYATSYIPTTSAGVTRLADAAYKTGISSLIGQAEGTMFLEVDLTHSTDPGVGTNQYFMQVYQDAGARILVFRTASNALNYYFLKGATAFFSNTSVTTNGRHKLAFAYKSGDSAFYIDGVQQHTSSAAFTAFASLAQLHIGANFNPSQAEIGDYSYSQALLFKTRLTNAQLAELTTL